MSVGVRKSLYCKSSAYRIRVLLIGTAAAAWASCASAQTAAQAQSQTAPGASVAAGDQLEEIVVTATKRDTALEKTPISMSAVTGASLAAAGVTDVHGLLQTTPSLSFVDGGPSQTRVFLRGIESAGEPTTGIYYDETPVPGAVGSSSDAGAMTPLVKLFDVNRVEALRGPQGTLYGSGSMGGTLRIIFNKPALDEYEATVDSDVTARKHGGDGYDVQGMVNIPIIKDEFAVRAVAYEQHDGGYIDNTYLHQNNVNTSDTQGGRLLARFQPNEDLTIDGSIIYQRSYGQDPKWTEGAGAYDSTAQSQLPYDDHIAIYNLTARWDLGPVAATAVVSDFHRKVMSGAQDLSYFFDTYQNNPADCTRFEGGGSPCSPAQQTTFNSHVGGFIPSAIVDTQTIDNPTAELRFSSTGKGFLDWTVGGFYSDRTNNGVIGLYGGNAATGALNTQNALEARTVHDELKQFAGFGEGAAHLTDKLTLAFGARYYDYQRTSGGQTTVGLNLIGATVGPYTQLAGAAETGWVTKTDLSYQFNSNLLGYVSASQGFRPGGVNQNVPLPVATLTYLPDTDWDYEVGFKTNWFDHRLVFDVDGYLIDWNNMQTLGHSAVNSLYQIIANAGTAQIKGIETSLTAMPIKNLTIQGNLTADNAVLTSNQVSPSLLLGTGGVSGNRIPYVPEVAGGVSGEYSWSLTDTLGGMARLDEDYVGSSYSEFNNAAHTQTTNPAYALTNARIGVEGPDKKWGVYLYVDNLFNRTAITYSFTQSLSAGKTLLTSAPPLTVGLNLRANF
jgi:iron complex outermembrane recepter protein